MSISPAYYRANTATNGTGDGTTFTNAFNSIVTAFSNTSSGAFLYLDATSNTEVLAAGSATLVGGANVPSNRISVIGVNSSNNAPTIGAKISSANGVTISLNGMVYIENTLIQAGNTTGSASLIFGGASVNTDWIFGPGAQLSLGSTSTGSNYNLGVGGAYNGKITIRGSATDRLGRFRYGANSQTIYIAGGEVNLKNIVMVDTTLGGSQPTYMFSIASTKSTLMECDAVDFTGMGNTLINNTGNILNNSPVLTLFKDCTFPSNINTIVNGSYIPDGTRIQFIRCSAAVGPFSNRVVTNQGWQTEDSTVTMQNGANDGQTLRSWKISTNNAGSLCNTSIVFGATWSDPYESQPMYIYNTTTGSQVNVAVEGIWAGSVVPNNDDVWIEVSALTDSASAADLSVVTTKSSLTATNAPVPAGTGTWNNAPAPGTTFKMTAPITPGAPGWIKVVVKVAKSNSDFWINPQVVLPGLAISRSYNSPAGGMVNETGTVRTVAGPTVYYPVSRMIAG